MRIFSSAGDHLQREDVTSNASFPRSEGFGLDLVDDARVLFFCIFDRKI